MNDLVYGSGTSQLTTGAKEQKDGKGAVSTLSMIAMMTSAVGLISEVQKTEIPAICRRVAKGKGIKPLMMAGVIAVVAYLAIQEVSSDDQ